MAVLCGSFEGSCPDPAMVPSVRRPFRDETEMHLAHLPVHRILRRTGPDKGDEPSDHRSRLCWRRQLTAFSSLSTLSSFPISSTTSWIISHHPATKVRCECCISTQKWFLPSSNALNISRSGNLISHIFRENEVCRDTEWERYFCYKNIEVPEIYSGPHLTFPLTVEQAVGLVEAFRNKKVGTPPSL